MPSGRIRRGDADIPLLMVELCHGKGSRIFGPETSLYLRYSVSRWKDLTYPEKLLAERNVTCIIYDADVAAGFAEFSEWEVAISLTDREFWQHMDNHSMRAYAVAEALLSGLTIKNVACFGRLVEFSRLWMRPSAAHGSRWASIVNAFIDRRYRHARKTRGAVLLLKPFPLEYENAFNGLGILEDALMEAALSARQAAMQRLYARTLGARKLHTGKWMWLPMGSEAPIPRKRRWRRFS